MSIELTQLFVYESDAQQIPKPIKFMAFINGAALQKKFDSFNIYEYSLPEKT